MAKKYYAVSNGRKNGVFESWEACKAAVHGFSGAQYKGFSSRADAQYFVEQGEAYRLSKYRNPANARVTKTSSSDHRALSRGAARTPERYFNSSEADASDGSSEAAPKMARIGLVGGVPVDATPLPHDIVYTDGSARGNGTARARGGIGVFYGPNDSRNISRPLQGKQTNQRAELTAMIEALKEVRRTASNATRGTTIASDSEYAMNCLTIWGKQQEEAYENAKKKPAKVYKGNNSDLIEVGRRLVKDIEFQFSIRGHGDGLKFEYVPGHKGIPGNEAADKLATRGATI